MKYIITADDFGLSESTNKTILQGIDEGIISSTNIMVNMPYLDDCAELLKKERVFVGIHWNLTTGKPVSFAEQIPSLVDGEGNMHKFSVFKEKVYKGEIKREDVETELRAQMEKYRKLFGKPYYWNTHNHTQMLTPLFGVFVRIASDYCVLNMRNNRKLYRGMNIEYAAKNLVIDSMYKTAKKKMKMPDGLISFSDKFPRYSLDSYCLGGDGIAEIMIHVATECDSVFFGNMTDERMKQKEFYFSREFKRAMSDNILYR